MMIDRLKNLVGQGYTAVDEQGNHLGCFEPFYLLYENLPKSPLPSAKELYFDSALKIVSENFFAVKSLEPYDMVLFELSGRILHAGVFLDAGKFLHVQKNSPYEIERLSRYDKNILGFFRAKQHLARK